MKKLLVASILWSHLAFAATATFVKGKSMCNGTPVAPQIIATLATCFADQEEIDFLVGDFGYYGNIHHHSAYQAGQKGYENLIAFVVGDEELDEWFTIGKAVDSKSGSILEKTELKEMDIITPVGLAQKYWAQVEAPIQYVAGVGLEPHAFTLSQGQLKSEDAGAPLTQTINGKKHLVGIAVGTVNGKDTFLRVDTADVQKQLKDFAKKHGLRL